MAYGKYERKPNKRKGGFLLKILIGVLAVILVLVIAGSFLVGYVLDHLGSFDDLPSESNGNEIPITDEFDTDSTIAGQETIQTMNAADVTFPEVEALEGENIINVMLIGQDARPARIP